MSPGGDGRSQRHLFDPVYEALQGLAMGRSECHIGVFQIVTVGVRCHVATGLDEVGVYPV